MKQSRVRNTNKQTKVKSKQDNTGEANSQQHTTSLTTYKFEQATIQGQIGITMWDVAGGGKMVYDERSIYDSILQHGIYTKKIL